RDRPGGDHAPHAVGIHSHRRDDLPLARPRLPTRHRSAETGLPGGAGPGAAVDVRGHRFQLACRSRTAVGGPAGAAGGAGVMTAGDSLGVTLPEYVDPAPTHAPGRTFGDRAAPLLSNKLALLGGFLTLLCLLVASVGIVILLTARYHDLYLHQNVR